MLKNRLISVLILRDGQVVQSEQFKHKHIIHWKAMTAIDFYDKWAVDEIVLLDVTRNTKKRNRFYEVLTELSEKCFVPLSVGGWIDSVSEIRKLLRMGADKVVINTKAVETPSLIQEGANIFGCQCIVVSIDVKRNGSNQYEVFTDRGRQPTGLDPVEWAQNVEQLGAGEVFLNSIDHDGKRGGYDLELMKRITGSIQIPVIAMGGVFEWQHLVDGIQQCGVDAVAAANIFHYTEYSTKKAKEYMKQQGIDVR